MDMSRYVLGAILFGQLVFVGVLFSGCGEGRRVMPENTIAITNRLEVHDGPTHVGRWRAYIIKDTLTEKQYLIIGNHESISVTPLEVAVEQ